MLAAHRRGARTHVGDFPRAWDAFARARRPRRATARELEILKALLQESVVERTGGNRPTGWLDSAGRASASGETGQRSPRPTTA
jgi:hypothetical protein